jgi:ketosteroid isomerase-like protein
MAMSQENVEIVRAIYERFGEGDFRASADLLDPHVVLVLRPEFGPEFSGAGTYLGAGAVAAYTREHVLGPWADFRMKAEEILAVGDTVLVSVHQRGVGRAGGVPTELRYFTLWSFRGRKVIRIESFRDRAAALEAAGHQE